MPNTRQQTIIERVSIRHTIFSSWGFSAVKMANATPPAMQMNVTTEIRRVQKVVDDLEGMLRQHQQILRQKAMSLPQGFLPELQKLRTDLDNIAKTLDEAQTEVVRLRSLSDTAELINSTLDLDDVLNAVMD